MSLLPICVKIFFARLLDVSIGTLRQNVMLKGKVLLTSILAFWEVFIWFVVAREALTININSILIPVFYSLGYATGTLIGISLSHKLIKGEVLLQVIMYKNSNQLLKALKVRGYPISLINLESKNSKPEKQMLLLEVNRKNVKKIENLIHKTAPKAFIIYSEPKRVLHGTKEI